MSTGWISVHRKIFDNPIWLSEKFTKAQAWIDLLLLANHSKGYILVRGIKLDIDRGQVGWSENALSARWKWSRTKVKNFLKLLEKEQQIKQQINKISLIITIVNYEEYQKENNKKSNRVYNRSATEEQEKDPNNNVNNIYTPEIKNFTGSFQEYILKNHPTKAPKVNDKLLESCNKTINQLINLDGFKLDYVIASLRWAMTDDFWSTQIFSLAALRTKSKNGLKKFQNLSNAYDNSLPEQQKEKKYVI